MPFIHIQKLVKLYLTSIILINFVYHRKKLLFSWLFTQLLQNYSKLKSINSPCSVFIKLSKNLLAACDLLFRKSHIFKLQIKLVRIRRRHLFRKLLPIGHLGQVWPFFLFCLRWIIQVLILRLSN